MTFRMLSRLVQAALLLAAPAVLVANEVRTAALDAPVADGARLQLQLANAPDQKVFSLADPHRIVIDLKSTTLARGLRLPQAAGPVTGLRSSLRPDGTTLRVVLELSRDLAPKVSINGTQLTVELGKLPGVAAPVTPAAPVRATHAPANAGRDIIIAVDAGHGGQDPGATGATGTLEKDVTLEIARALAKRINAEPGMHAYLTRDSDRFIKLQDRTVLARGAGADMFISVHADSIKDRSVSGSSVYVLNSTGASNVAARRLAEKENAADLKGGVAADEAGDSLASVLIDLSQTASIAKSNEAARRVLAQLDQVGVVRKSQVENANFAVLKTPDTLSLLVETAYISNPGEEKKLRSPEHQARIAEAIFSGVSEYFRYSPPDGTLYAQQRDKRNAAPTIVADRSRP
jgi:N-acetylmuramoyl-L-alanine amidase